MKHIVGIGANVCDTLIGVHTYPTEDTKQAATEIVQCGGGPCATGLTTAARLGADCAFIGSLTDDAAGSFLYRDLEKYKVSTELVESIPGYTSFSSYIFLSEDTAARTCVFHRGNVPKKPLTESQKGAIRRADILMVDGNDLEMAIEGARVAKESGTMVLYDAGGLYDGVEKLLALTDILIPSCEFSLKVTGESDVRKAAEKLYNTYSPSVLVITMGKEGGILYDGKACISYPSFPVNAVDTNGAGDVFHGAFAYAYAEGLSAEKACVFSSAVSAIKCTKVGARAAVPTRAEVIEFLRERGYDEFEKNLD